MCDDGVLGKSATSNNQSKQTLRDLLSVLPKIGLIKKPRFHQEGISVILPVKDEAEWIEHSILSIEPIANEIIIIDSSTEDDTTNIIAKLAKTHSKIKHIRFYYDYPNTIALKCHLGLVNASYKWVFKWEGDMVAKSEGLQIWKNRLNQLDKNRYYVIDLPRVNLEGDIYHQPKNYPLGGTIDGKAAEARIFTWSPELKYIMKITDQVMGDSIWGQRFPPWYKRLGWEEPYIFHCNIKNPKRMLMRIFWIDYMAYKGTQFKTLDEYTKFRVETEWHMTIEEAEQKVMIKLTENLMPYDKRRFGDLPEALTRKEQI